MAGTDWECQKNYKMVTSWGTLPHVPRGVRDCLTPVCSCCGTPLQTGNILGQLLAPACTIAIGPVWAGGPKWLWNKHKTEHHFYSELQWRQCLTTWICPRTCDSSSSWGWGLTCLFSITNALDIVTIALNKTELLLAYHIHPNKQHTHRTCPTGNTAQFEMWFGWDNSVFANSYTLRSWTWKAHQHLKCLRCLESTVSGRQLPHGLSSGSAALGRGHQKPSIPQHFDLKTILKFSFCTCEKVSYFHQDSRSSGPP